MIQKYLLSPYAVKQAVLLSDFAQAIIAVEDGKISLTSAKFSEEMAQLGFNLDNVFHQNRLDYTTRQLIREKFHYTCQYCGRYGDSVDHKDPVFFSQDNSLTNLTLACHECNRLKGDMPYALFVKLNQQISPLNQELVQFENILRNLKQRIDTNRRHLAARQHLALDPRDPSLRPFRKKAKTLQFLYDGVNSDYQKKIQLRHDDITTQAKIYEDYPNK